jgi:hypothetical protein
VRLGVGAWFWFRHWSLVGVLVGFLSVRGAVLLEITFDVGAKSKGLKKRSGYAKV